MTLSGVNRTIDQRTATQEILQIDNIIEQDIFDVSAVEQKAKKSHF